ncbi:hypothetical protein VTN02DRAFT_3965 [Thermoascus thermophilus]
MVKNYDNKPTSSASSAASDERISVVKLSKSGGCVDRDAAFMKALRESQIREYFFGNPIPSTASSALSLSATSSTTNITLSPHAQQLDFDALSVYNITVVTPDEEDDDYDPSQFGAGESFLPGGAHDDLEPTSTLTPHPPDDGTRPPSSLPGIGGAGPGPSAAAAAATATTPATGAAAAAAAVPSSAAHVPLKKVPSPPPSNLANTLLAITHVAPNAPLPDIRDASIMGFVYVADVDAARGKIRVLAPVGGRVPARAILWGRKWPGEVVGLVG